LKISKEEVAVSCDDNEHSVLAQGTWHRLGVVGTSEIDSIAVGMERRSVRHENHQ
jgi:hypothetical protein